MPVWPKSYYTFRANLLTARTAARLRRRDRGTAAQNEVFSSLVRRLAQGRHWRALGVESGMSYERFRAQVPLQTSAQLAAPIARMLAGEADVLWPGRCELFATTAGTESGEPHAVPITNEMLGHLRRTGGRALLQFAAKAGNAGVFRGRHLLLGGPTGVTAASPARGLQSTMAGIAALALPAWAERHLCENGGPAAPTHDWAGWLQQAVRRARALDLTVLAGLPQSLLQFADAARQQAAESGKPAATLQAIWPNLECVVHTGSALGPFQPELRAALGSGVAFHEVYAATEGIIAAQESEPAAGLRLIADGGLFFEFVPMTEFDEARVDQLGPRAVPLGEVKPGVEYALVVTSPAGLARLVLGDVVRFTSTEPPRLIHVGGTRLQLNHFGERVNERQLTDAFVGVCQRQRWTIMNFHVAPLQEESFTGQPRGRHEWWVELKPGTVATPTGPQIAAQLDAELLRVNEHYAARRRGGVMEAPFVRLVMPGVFEHWLKHRERWGGLHKMPRCRSDRLVAAELAHITSFAPD